MKQVAQTLAGGGIRVLTVPDPTAAAGQVLIANGASVLSAGTEKAAIEIAQKSLIGKARERPDQVRRVLQKLRTEGVRSTVSAVRAKLNEPMPMGYSSAGVVVACGPGVQGFKVGQRVASNGPHAGVVSVPINLCAHVPADVSTEHAAFAVLGAIGMQGIRLGELRLGETAFVVGLGLVGQLTVGLLRAAGVRVIGTDPDARRCELAVEMGAVLARPDVDASTVRQHTGALGADAVLLTASTRDNGPIELAAEAVRKRGRVVLVGVVGLDVPRRPFYFSEATFVVSCSYGPGRYDPEYEDRGHDYPAAYVRWTEQRNIQAVLDLMGTGALDVSRLVSHRFSIEAADRAYALIEDGGEPYLGIVLTYPDVARPPQRRIELRARPAGGRIRVGCIGAGSFARTVLLPAIRRAPGLQPRVLCSGRGLSATTAAEQLGFAAVATDAQQLAEDSDLDAIFVITRHNQHAEQVLSVLRARKHCFVEKPLALTVDELDQIDAALREVADSAPVLMVGFNRRFSAAARQVREHFAKVATPLTVSIRFNAGEIPAEHWTQLEEEGGRIIGEACHAIDLATYLTGSPPVRVFAESIGGPGAPRTTDDQCFITLRHADGSISSVAYLAGGDRALAKERVEVFGGGRVGIIDDFRRVQTVANGVSRTKRASGKGHTEEVQAFAEALRGGTPAPIGWDELYRVSLASILAVRSIREGIPFEIPPPGGSG